MNAHLSSVSRALLVLPIATLLVGCSAFQALIGHDYLGETISTPAGVMQWKVTRADFSGSSASSAGVGGNTSREDANWDLVDEPVRLFEPVQIPQGGAKFKSGLADLIDCGKDINYFNIAPNDTVVVNVPTGKGAIKLCIWLRDRTGSWTPMNQIIERVWKTNYSGRVLPDPSIATAGSLFEISGTDDTASVTATPTPAPVATPKPTSTPGGGLTPTSSPTPIPTATPASPPMATATPKPPVASPTPSPSGTTNVTLYYDKQFYNPLLPANSFTVVQASDSFDLGEVPVGEVTTEVLPLKLTNTGTVSTAVTFSSLAQFSVATPPAQIAAGGAATFAISPRASVGNLQETLTITMGSKSYKILLSARVVP